MLLGSMVKFLDFMVFIFSTMTVLEVFDYKDFTQIISERLKKNNVHCGDIV